MPPISCDPPLAASDGFLQIVRLTEDGRPMGSARWHSPTGSSDGVVQILDFHIDLKFQRQGYGKRLLTAVIEQCIAYHKLRQIPLRRIWLGLNHRRHVIARAFFLSQGFTHIVTAKELLLPTDDLLIYVRTFN
jgi:GNAT superfamily N-acetyltransferase